MEGDWRAKWAKVVDGGFVPIGGEGNRARL